MEREPNIMRTGGPVSTCVPGMGSGLRHLALSIMGTHSDDPLTAPTTDTAAGLRRLTGPELEACVLHLADGWPQATVAGWLGVSRRGVQLLLASAAAKVPALRSLWVRSVAPPVKRRRPRVLHLSQLSAADGMPLDADDL